MDHTNSIQSLFLEDYTVDQAGKLKDKLKNIITSMKKRPIL